MGSGYMPDRAICEYIRYEFYHTFLEHLTAELSKLFNSIKLSHSTPNSSKNAIVKLLLKKKTIVD